MFILAMGLMGCGKSKVKGPRGKVHGTATYRQAPLAAGTQISFVGENGAAAAGLTGPDGAFELRTVEGSELPTGGYRVTVAPPSTTEPTAEQAMASNVSPEARPADTDSPPPASGFPSKYLNVVTSPERFEVKEGDNVYNLELTD